MNPNAGEPEAVINKRLCYFQKQNLTGTGTWDNDNKDEQTNQQSKKGNMRLKPKSKRDAGAKDEGDEPGEINQNSTGERQTFKVKQETEHKQDNRGKPRKHDKTRLKGHMSADHFPTPSNSFFLCDIVDDDLTEKLPINRRHPHFLRNDNDGWSEGRKRK